MTSRVSAQRLGANPSIDWARSLAAAAVVVVCGAIGFVPLAPVLHELWTDPYGAFSHGYLVLALSVWLGIHHWREAAPARLAPWPLAVLPLAALVVVLLSMEAMLINSARLVLIPFILITAIAFVFGREAARRLLWPIMYLFFALPQWWPLNGVLQSITSKVVGFLVNVTDLAAYVEGNFIQVPAGMIEVATGCSGLNFMIAALALAGFYAFMHLKRMRSWAALLVFAAAMACISNWLRVYALVAVGIWSDMQHYLIRVDHLYFGWALFMTLMVPVLLLARRLDLADARAVSASAAAGSSSGMPGTSRAVLPAAAAAGCILLVPAFVSVDGDGAPVRAHDLPERAGSWMRRDGAASAWEPAFLNAEEVRTRYERGEHAIELFRASYPRQSFEARVVRAQNDFFGRGWRLAERSLTSSNSSAAEQVVESRGYLNGEELLIWSWYVVAGQSATTKLGAKLQEIRGFVLRRRDASAFAISAQCIPDCAAARARLGEFMQESAASLR